jgi:preprotein translocase subunit SecD
MKISFKVWILIIFVIFSIISIFPADNLFTQGVEVTSVKEDSQIFSDGLRSGMIIKDINGQKINSKQDFTEFMNNLPEQKEKTSIQTDSLEIINLYNNSITESFTVSEIPITRLETGLDLQGGARALVVKDEGSFTEQELDDVVSQVGERLNTHGLKDVQIKKVSDLSGNRFMLVEISGATPDDLEDLIATPGKFEAKIGKETVFVGGEEDIKDVSTTGINARVQTEKCQESSDGSIVCPFAFSVILSNDAANRFADITSQLKVNSSLQGSYLEKTIDFYLDGELRNSLNIVSTLKGKAETQISITGSGEGTTYTEATENAERDMKKLQTVLKTGNLPKLDTISPNLGKDFTKNILKAGLFAIISVFILVFVRYRNLKTSFALVAVSFCEVLIILGVASLIKWNLDLPSIAGIIATIGTGIDSQLVILDEAKQKGESIKQKIKKALFIIFTAFATTFVALVPLTGWVSFLGVGAVSAGLLKGFAITTLIGITTGVLITRPAFAAIAEKLQGEN